MAEQNSGREDLRKVLQKASKGYATAPESLNAMRAAVLLDILDNSEFNDFEFYQLAAKILGSEPEDILATKKPKKQARVIR